MFLISGGFRELIEPLAEHLDIPPDHIFANKLLFTKDGQCVSMCVCVSICVLLGQYGGFDESQPTSRSGGKPLVVGEIKKQHKM